MPNDYYTMLYTGEKTDELLQRVDEGEIIIPSSTAGSTKKFKPVSYTHLTLPTILRV